MRPTNLIVVNLDIEGQLYSFTWNIPDVGGQVRPSDRNRKWVKEQIETGLKGKFGRLIPKEG